MKEPEKMILPKIDVAKGFDSVEDEFGTKGFGVYVPDEKQIYVAGEVPHEVLVKALFHELMHWIQDVSGRGFDEDEADQFACRIYDVLMSAEPEQTNCEYCHEDSNGYVRPIEKNSHAWLVRRGRTMKLRVSFKGGYSECDILYCPMCGRRLTDG